MTAVADPWESEGLSDQRPITIPLQSAGLISTLIFLISSIYEVLVVNRIHQSQFFLIALLLGMLSIWAFLEVSAINRPRSIHRLQTLKFLLALQIGLIAMRHWPDFAPGIREGAGTSMGYPVPELGQAAVFLPAYLVLFLAISRCLIDIFAAAERLRANQLQEQMLILRKTRYDLERSEIRYRNFFNLPLVGTAILSEGQGWLAANDRACTMLGYSREELFEHSWSALTHPHDLARERYEFERMLRGEIDGYQIEKRFLRKDGSILHTLVAGGYGPGGEEQPDLFHMNIIDICDRKQIEAKLAAAQDREKAMEQQQRSELEQKLKTSLTASAVVHEIQQPLATILLNCRLAEATLERLPDTAIPEMLRQQLSQLTTNGDQVTATMERMRMLLRNVETQPTPLDLANNVESALVFLRPDLQQNRVQVHSSGLDTPCPCLGDGAQLQSAIVNLIRNAIQAMSCRPEDSRHLLIQLQRHPDFVEIEVADSGPGFPLDYNGTTSWELLKSTKATGMGIGLFLAQTAAINHGGTLRIGRSDDLDGALVVITMPLRQTHAN